MFIRQWWCEIFVSLVEKRCGAVLGAGGRGSSAASHGRSLSGADGVVSTLAKQVVGQPLESALWSVRAYGITERIEHFADDQGTGKRIADGSAA